MENPAEKIVKKNAGLLVANWESDVGYAWWLMESFWVCISKELKDRYDIRLAYPEVNDIPKTIADEIDKVDEFDFCHLGFRKLFSQLYYIYSNKIKWIYFTDQPLCHWVYIFFRLAGVRAIIVHDHSPGLRKESKGLVYWFKYLIHKFPIVSADASLSVSKFIYDRHLKTNVIPKARCYLVENGIKLINDIDSVDIKTKFNIPENRKVMICVSRANPYKNIDFVIHSMNVVVNELKRDDIHFLFCGDGPALEDLRKQAEDSGISNFVTLPGRCSNILGILSDCDFAIHPSKGEAFSLAILEYMFCKLPLIVSDNPSVCFATQNDLTGFIYKEDNLQSAVEAIIKMADDDSKRQSMGETAKQKVIENYNLEFTHSNLIKAINTILKSKNLI